MRTASVAGLCLVAVSAFDGGNKITETAPVRPLFTGDVVVANYLEFNRGKAMCGGSSLGTKKCWTDGEGKMFRFGCTAGDTRIFTDSCDENCENCDGKWAWGGEQRDTCYDDGSNLYHFSCPVDGPSASTEPTKAEAKSCAELGWPLQPGDLNVCAYSQVDNGMCPSSVVNFQAASEMCADSGGRLCTAAELLNDEAKGTGCKADCVPVWTSDSCGAGHSTVAGANKCKKQFPETCTEDNELATVRCCADVLGLDGAPVTESGYPEGFSPAIGLDFRLEDGQCGLSDPTAHYSCWTDPKNFVAMRFACSDNDDFVYYQTCGNDSDCNPQNCHGEWTKTGEFVENCYSHPTSYLYHYVCPGRK